MYGVQQFYFLRNHRKHLFIQYQFGDWTCVDLRKSSPAYFVN